MRWFFAVPLALLLGVAACGDDDRVGLGERCGGNARYPDVCQSHLYCCQPDPTIFDIPGTCIDPVLLAGEGQVCGKTAAVCCAQGTYCDANGVTGDGRCVSVE